MRGRIQRLERSRGIAIEGREGNELVGRRGGGFRGKGEKESELG